MPVLEESTQAQVAPWQGQAIGADDGHAAQSPVLRPIRPARVDGDR